MPASPSPGDDATPFLLRCFASPAPFRPVADFEPATRPVQDEYKLYVWKTTTLRELAQLLHEANPSLSQPLTLHAFRLISFNSHRSQYVARDAGVGITRVPLKEVEHLLDGLELDSFTSHAYESIREEVDEKAARTTLQQLRIVEGDVLDCVTKAGPNPALPDAGPMRGAATGSGGFGPPRQRF